MLKIVDHLLTATMAPTSLLKGWQLLPRLNHLAAAIPLWHQIQLQSTVERVLDCRRITPFVHAE